MNVTRGLSRGSAFGLIGIVVIGLAAYGNSLMASGAQRHADPRMVLLWSSEASTTIVTVGARFPCRAAVYKGIVHAAIYDAVVGIEGGFEWYTAHAPAPAGASADAAAAQAAHDVLVALFPAQQARLDGVLASSLAMVRSGNASASGRAFGRQIALDILALRVGDGLEINPPYTPPTGPGAFVPQPNPIAPGLGQVRPLILASGDQFRPDGPPPLDSKAYARDLAEVRLIGRLESPIRSAGQTEGGLFFVEHAVLQSTRALNRLSTEQTLTRLGAARMLALTALATGDACIACWDAKYHYSFWRPITAIQADATEPDPTWTPLLGTPNHPSYPSGHGCYTGALTEALEDFFGTDRVEFTVDSTSSGTTHTFQRFSALSARVVEARVWSGIHFRFDDNDGFAIGRKVARWLRQNFLRPAS